MFCQEIVTVINCKLHILDCYASLLSELSNIFTTNDCLNSIIDFSFFQVDEYKKSVNDKVRGKCIL